MSDHNVLVSQIKDRIKEARERKQLTQAAVATHLGISRTAITQWEAGLTFPSYDKAMDLAKLLGVRPEWIAFGVTTPVEFRTPTESVKVNVVSFGDDHEDRKVVGTHYLDTAFVRDTLRASTNSSDLFIYVLESESFAPRYNPFDQLIVDASAKKVTEGQYLIWNGLTAQLVTIQANYNEPGTVTVRATERGEGGNVIEVTKLVVLGRIRGRLGASHS